MADVDSAPIPRDYRRMLAIPLTGDLVVRTDQHDLYTIVESDSGRVVAGPFDQQQIAVRVAESLATRQHVRAWLQQADELIRLP
jgi:hypothetical protein